MTRYLLLIVQDVFALSNGLIIVVPDFPVVDGISGHSCGAVIRTPSKNELPCKVRFEPGHFNIPGCADTNRLWRLVPTVSGIEKPDIEIGSELIIEDDVIASALGLRVIL